MLILKKKKIVESKYYYFNDCDFVKCSIAEIQKQLDSVCGPNENIALRLNNTFAELSNVRVFELELSKCITVAKQLDERCDYLISEFRKHDYFTMIAEQIWDDSGSSDRVEMLINFAVTDCSPKKHAPAILFYWNKKK